MDPLPFQTEAHRRAAQLTALTELGFERVEGPATTESYRLEDGRYKVSQTLAAMGTSVCVAALHRSQAAAEQSIGVAFAEMQRMISVLNRYDDASALGVLNERGRLEDAPDELLLVLHRAAGLYRLSGGAFDVSVQPLVDLLRDCHERGQACGPRPDQVAAALTRVAGHDVKIEGRRVELGRDGMGLTLDGIAKGFIVDGMAMTLAAAGIEDFLINAGGDIRAAGQADGPDPWLVSIQDPDRGDDFPDLIEMTGGAIATSGSYEIHFNREQTLHHLVHSGTGASTLESRSVSVCAPSALQADAIATAVFVMRPRHGLRLLDSLPGCEGLIVTRDEQHLRSAGWASARHRAVHSQER